MDRAFDFVLVARAQPGGTQDGSVIKIRRHPIDSSVIATMGYDPLAKMLDIEFKDDGKVYRYFDVPLSEYEAFMEAPSKGTYLNRELKKAGYLYDVVDQVKRRRIG